MREWSGFWEHWFLSRLLPLVGLDRSAFDNKSVSFEEHIRCEHNLWHYLYFIVLVRVKDPTEFTGPESYVDAMMKEKNLEWFPRMRAMSLAADEAESEQNEMRTLQNQLEETQQLVATLSRQLTDLRDQVSLTLPLHASFVHSLEIEAGPLFARNWNFQPVQTGKHLANSSPTKRECIAIAVPHHTRWLFHSQKCTAGKSLYHGNLAKLFVVNIIPYVADH